MTDLVDRSANHRDQQYVATAQTRSLDEVLTWHGTWNMTIQYMSTRARMPVKEPKNRPSREFNAQNDKALETRGRTLGNWSGLVGWPSPYGR